MSLLRSFVITLAAALALHAGPAGSARVRPQDVALFDQAYRLYRDGKPLVMAVTGSTVAVGTAAGNLRLSQQRVAAALALHAGPGAAPGCDRRTWRCSTRPPGSTGTASRSTYVLPSAPV